MATQVVQARGKAVPVGRWFSLRVDTKIIRVKLVHLGNVYGLIMAEEMARRRGYCIVGDEAVEPLRNKFPDSSGKDPILFGGKEEKEQGLIGHANVARLYDIFGKWYLKRVWSRLDFGDNYLWLVCRR